MHNFVLCGLLEHVLAKGPAASTSRAAAAACSDILDVSYVREICTLPAISVVQVQSVVDSPMCMMVCLGIDILHVVLGPGG